GVKAYINSYRLLKKEIALFKPDVIHAHYGLSGFFANWQRAVPVVTTYHGGDINYDKARPFSRLAIKFSKHNIFVSHKLANKAGVRKKFSIKPCGINLRVFFPEDKMLAREKLKLKPGQTYVLFSSSFTNRIKNSALAKEAVEKTGKDIQLIELKGYSREEVARLLNACDVALLTSFMEGSPQFIKEAMACNCPIVSTNVGSVEEIIDHTEGCYLTSFDPDDVSEKLKQAIAFGKRTNGHQKISHLDNDIMAEKIISVYKSILPKA
ncbi:MAG: glycosyltransferase, partial [Bacteroidales bacterium]|nr:glycosyltransferase [Bacteroidales bacterium]